MEKFKKVLFRLPEYYLIAAALLYWFTPPLNVNPIATGLVAVLVLQAIFKNRMTGLIIASLFLAINLFMLLALISEFNEFPSFTADAGALLGVGLLLFLINVGMAILMIYKYTQQEQAVAERQA